VKLRDLYGGTLEPANGPAYSSLANTLTSKEQPVNGLMESDVDIHQPYHYMRSSGGFAERGFRGPKELSEQTIVA
jgi:hypothetical protein